MGAFSFIKSWLTPQFDAQIAPEGRFVVIGDIHGHAELLVDLLEILLERERRMLPLVFVGDYVDRGENSANVIRILRKLQTDLWQGGVTCLKGNHEDMLLWFLDAPERTGAVWLRNGGRQTLASYGVALPDGSPDGYCRARDDLQAALGEGEEDWLRGLPLSFRSGNVFVSHAGCDPGRPIDAQDEQHLLWGHPDFFERSRSDGIWVAHGHHIHKLPVAAQGRIAVDTGGYATHRLTAAIIDEGACHFASTR